MSAESAPPPPHLLANIGKASIFHSERIETNTVEREERDVTIMAGFAKKVLWGEANSNSS